MANTLFDLAQDNKNLAAEAIKKLNKLRPEPLNTHNTANLITPRNYEDDLDNITDADLVIEAVAENITLKM